MAMDIPEFVLLANVALPVNETTWTWETKCTLGKGANGAVYETNERKDRVVKITAFILNYTHKEVFFHYWAHRAFPHIVVNLTDAWTFKGKTHMVMERMTCHMDDRRFRRIINAKSRISRYTEAQLYTMFAISKLMTKANVLHGDMKPNNFLIDELSGTIKLTDFGFAGWIDPSKPDVPMGTNKWLPVNGFPSILGAGPHEVVGGGHLLHKYLPDLNSLQLDLALRTHSAIIVTDDGKEYYYQRCGYLVNPFHRNAILNACTKWESESTEFAKEIIANKYDQSYMFKWDQTKYDKIYQALAGAGVGVIKDDKCEATTGTLAKTASATLGTN